MNIHWNLFCYGNVIADFFLAFFAIFTVHISELIQQSEKNQSDFSLITRRENYEKWRKYSVWGFLLGVIVQIVGLVILK